MSTPSAIEIEIGEAIDDEAALHRSLRIVKAFYLIYGENETTARYINELSDHLIGVKQRARKRHQALERQRLAAKDDAEIAAQMM